MAADGRHAPFGPSRAAAVLVAGLAVGALAHSAARTSSERAGRGPRPDAGVPRLVEAPPDAGPPESAAARALREGRPVDVNRASARDLELLPRIGPALAGRIVESREAEGPFEEPEDLARVRGIGPRTVERLRRFVVTTDGPPDAGPSVGRATRPAVQDPDG